MKSHHTVKSSSMHVEKLQKAQLLVYNRSFFLKFMHGVWLSCVSLIAVH